MRTWMKQHSLLAFFLLACIWSWSLWMSLVFTTPADSFLTGNIPPIFFVFALAGGFGLSISGIVISRIMQRDGARQLLGGLKKPRLTVKWLLFAILCVPMLTALQALAHALTGRSVTFSLSTMTLVMGIMWPLFSSLGEEPGWRGFALPKLLERYSPLKAALYLGFIWGLWHMPSDYIAYSSYGWWFIPLFLFLGPINLMAHSVIMTFLYKKTRGILLIMVIYHYTITMCGILAPGLLFDGQADDVLKSAVSVAVIVAGALLVAIFSKTLRHNGVLARPVPLEGEKESVS